MHCTSCGSELPDGSAFCNGCGVAQEAQGQTSASDDGMPKTTGQKVAAGMLLALILFLMWYMVGSSGPEPQTAAQKREAGEVIARVDARERAQARAKVREQDLAWREEAERERELNQPSLELLSKEHRPARYGNGHIVGKIKNNTTKDYRYVQVTFELLDGDRNTVGTSLANIAGLRAGATWSYQASVLRDFKYFRLQKITGY